MICKINISKFLLLFFVLFMNYFCFAGDLEEEKILLSPNIDLSFVKTENQITDGTKTDNDKNTTFFQSENVQQANGLFFVYELFLDKNSFIKSDSINEMALEKSILKNYAYFEKLEKNLKNKPILLTFKPVFFEFLKAYDDFFANLRTAEKFFELNNRIISEKAIDRKLETKDKIFILKAVKNLPADFVNEQVECKKLVDKINYEILNSTNSTLISQNLSSFNNDFFIKVLVFYHIFWLDETSQENYLIKTILENSSNLTKKDLQTILDYKREIIVKTAKFFRNLPKDWNFLICPYFEPRLDILSSSNLTSHFSNGVNVNLSLDASWQIARSFKAHSVIFSMKNPAGIFGEINFVDQNIMKILSARNYEIVVNKVDSKNNAPVFLQTESKNLYMFFANIFFNFDQNDFFVFQNKYSEFQKNNVNSILIFDLEKSNLKVDVFNEFVSQISKNCQFLDLLEFRKIIFKDFLKTQNPQNKAAILELPENEIKKNHDKITENAIVNILNINDQDFLINLEFLQKFFDSDEKRNYWIWLKSVRAKLDEKRNKNEIDVKIYTEILNEIYILESKVFIENLNDFASLLNREFQYLSQKINAILKLQNLMEFSMTSRKNNLFFLEDDKGFYLEDFLNDDYGDGKYEYPDSQILVKGMLDIKSAKVFYSGDNIVFKFSMGKLNNFTNSKYGFSGIQLDIYIDMNGRKGLGNIALADSRKAVMKPENAWEYFISINGLQGAKIYQSTQDQKMNEIAKLSMKIEKDEDAILVVVPKKILDGDIFVWNYVFLSLGFDDSKSEIIKVENLVSKTSFGGRRDEYQTNIIDIILSPNVRQEELFAPRKSAAEIPAVKIN